MKEFASIDSFLRHLATLPEAVRAAERKGLDDAGKGLVAGAREMIGEEVREWPVLADMTVSEKQRLGFTGRISSTDPLYRTGELRVSISYRLEDYGVVFGSTDPVAAYQEFGTIRIPPRPFIGATAFRDGHAAADLVVRHMLAAFVGKSPPASHSGPLTGR